MLHYDGFNPVVICADFVKCGVTHMADLEFFTDMDYDLTHSNLVNKTLLRLENDMVRYFGPWVRGEPIESEKLSKLRENGIPKKWVQLAIETQNRMRKAMYVGYAVSIGFLSIDEAKEILS